MESWMVMLVALVVVCAFCPPLLGFIAAAGAVMLVTTIVSNVMGG